MTEFNSLVLCVSGVWLCSIKSYSTAPIWLFPLICTCWHPIIFNVVITEPQPHPHEVNNKISARWVQWSRVHVIPCGWESLITFLLVWFITWRPHAQFQSDWLSAARACLHGTESVELLRWTNQSVAINMLH